MILVDYEITPVAGHYDVYIDGEFYCSADSHSEAKDEVEKYFENMKLNA